MSPLQSVQAYVKAWNDHDPAAVVATFASDGTYNDPLAGGDLSGQALADYAAEVFAALPDVSFQTVSFGMTEDGVIAVEYLMQGANTGMLRGVVPSGKAVSVPGSDFITVGSDGKIRSVKGYFDLLGFYEQLGCTVSIV